ncbi:MAG TPA: M50 family metallopeptidase, partial [Candidatus Limnocylindrales bacterium]|nr:M50 family metallopeptidase [Candidatus Limnocylindrales bacterium]
MLLLIIGLILFVGLVVIHEFGHFIMARRNGVVVEEFGIGFPPKVWSRKTKGGWLFSINLLPLGGFVRMKGETDSDTEEGTFGAASLAAKTKIMAAGVVMNLITAIIMLTGLAWLGMPQLIPNQFTVKSDTKVIQQQVLAGRVDKDSPASKAGLQSSDQIISIGAPGKETPIKTEADLPKVTKQLAGQKVAMTYVQDGQTKRGTAQLLSEQQVAASKKTDNPKGYLGVVPTEYSLQRSTWSAPLVALGLTKQFTILTFQGLGKALTGVGSIIAGAVTGNSDARREGQTKASEQVSGPVGIFAVLKNGSFLGYQFMLLVIAIISLTLAIMNFLPIPALDGGRLWLTLATRGLGYPISQEKEELI